MRPAQTGQGIISDGKLEAGMTALWRIRPTNDDCVNYSLLLRRSQENCALHTARCGAVSFLGITHSSHCRTSNSGALRQRRYDSARASLAMQGMRRAANVAWVAATEPSTSMPRQASLITKTVKPSRTASSAE
jgi:hypothetical protein